MQLSQEPYSSSSIAHGADDHTGGSRRKKSSVTFPPIHSAATEAKQRQPSILSLRNQRPSDFPLAFAADHAAAANDARSVRSTSPFEELSVRASPPPKASRSSSRHSADHNSERGARTTRLRSRVGKECGLPPVAAFHHIAAQVEHEDAEARKLLRDGNVGAALQTWQRALHRIQESTSAPHARRSTATGLNAAALAPTAAAASSPLVGSLLSGSQASASSTALSVAQMTMWRTEVSERLAVLHTVAASTAGVRCGVTAESLPTQKACFQAAMRYVVDAAEENLFPEWKRTSRAGSASRKDTSRPASGTKAMSKGSKKGAAPYHLAANCTDPRVVTRAQLLRCAVRNNAAVCLADRSSSGGQARTIYELLKALADSRGVWAAVVLYNLAVSFLSVEHYDDAAEAIARCMELSYHYLSSAERAQHELPSPPTEVVLGLRDCMARQLIRAHHFIATMAAWCDPAGTVEVQHCDMAVGCAERYLGPSDPKLHECQRRLAAARRRCAAGATPQPAAPLLPFQTMEFLLSGALPTQSMFSTTSGAVDVSALVDGLFSISAAVPPAPAHDLPAEVRAYVKAAQQGSVLRHWVKEAQRGGAAPPFLSAAAALAPLPAVLLASPDSGADETDETGWNSRASSPRGGAASARSTAAARKSKPQQPAPASPRANASSGNLLASSAQSTVASLGVVSETVALSRPSRPAPCFVTTLPQSTFSRYRNLRASVVMQLESAELAASTDREATEEGGGDGEEGEEEKERRRADTGGSTVMVTSTSHRSGRLPEQLKMSTTLPFLPDGASVKSSSGRRLTALFYGASGTLTEAWGSTPRSHNTESPSAASEGSQRADPARSTSPPTILAVPVRPSELLRQLDSETEACYSRLVADPLADLHRESATRLQSWWRMQVAQKERRRRSAAVERCCLQDSQALRIQCAVRDWRRRRRQAEARERVYHARYLEEQAAVVQGFLRYRESLQLWGRACLVWHEQLLQCSLERKRQEAAAVRLQSWWRMLATQAALQDRIRRIICLQALWRGGRVRAEQRALRVHRRLAQEAFYDSQLPRIVRLQRWWRWCTGCRAARAVTAERQQAVCDYLTSLHSTYDDAMTAGVRAPDSAIAAMRTVLAILSGARDRRLLATAHRHAAVRRRAVHRYVLRYRGQEQRVRLRRERAARLRVERRREEVAVAVLRLQRWVRVCLPRCRATRAVRSLGERDAAAAAIQAAWRQRQARRQRRAFSGFLSQDRHQYATAIQRAWRAHHTRSIAAKTAATQHATEADQLPAASPTPIPSASSPSSTSAFRYQVPQPPTVRDSRVSIASADGDAAHSPQQHRNSSSADSTKLPHGNVPALPGFSAGSAHGRACSSTAVPMAEVAHHSPSCSALPESLSRLTGSTDKPLYFFSSDSTYEHYGAGRVHRPSASCDYEADETDEEGEEEEESEEEEGEEDVEASASGSPARASRTRGGDVESNTPVAPAAQLSEPSSSDHAAAPPSAAAFPIPRPPAPQRVMCTVHCNHTPEEIAAATYIQAVWRGYRERCRIEYYYEEYYEEVEGEEEEGEEEEAAEDSDDAES